MKIVSFNVNSIRARLHQLEAVVDKHAPDFIALQETKVQDADFPVDAIRALGYHAVWHGQKTHYGVALLSRQQPLSVQKGFPDEKAVAQRRMVACAYPLGDDRTLQLVNGYFPQGESRHHPVKFPDKQRFYADMTRYLDHLGDTADYLAVVGDMNVAPQDMDVGIGQDNVRRWLRSGKCSFLPEERDWLNTMKQAGLVDCFRCVHPAEADLYSWFDYRSRGFEREPKRGLRIDLVLGSASLAKACVAAGIDYEIRGMIKPSDHAPVWAEFVLPGQ